MPDLSKTLIPLPFEMMTLIQLISSVFTTLARTCESFGLFELPKLNSSSGKI